MLGVVFQGSPLDLGETVRRDFAWCIWIFPVEFRNGFVSMCDVLGRFPAVMSLVESFPSDEVLELTSVEPTVQDPLYLPLFFTVYFNRRRRRWFAILLSFCILR